MRGRAVGDDAPSLTGPPGESTRVGGPGRAAVTGASRNPRGGIPNKGATLGEGVARPQDQEEQTMSNAVWWILGLLLLRWILEQAGAW